MIRSIARLFAIPVAILFLLCIGASAQTGAAHPEFLVSTDWLAGHLKDPNVVIVQVGHDEADYKKQHIAGTRWLDWSKIASKQFPGTELLPADELKANLEAIGLTDSTHVVIYTTDYDPIASRLFYTLDYLGQADHASLLDGSLDTWIKESRPVTTDVPTFAPGKLTVKLHPEVNAHMDWLEKQIADPNAKLTLVDARPMSRYESGHLPGAQPMYWQTTQTNHVLKSPDELRKMFAAAGYTSDKKIVSYCEVGQQATYTYFLARYLGLDAAMYDGSYNEWSTDKKPVVEGKSPR